MPALMVVGCGNIGSRLLQSLSNLELGPYDIYGIEPFDGNWEMVRARFDEENKGGHNLHLQKSPEGVPGQVDLLILSMDARNRLPALRAALAETRPKAILLEKILFTKPEDFAEAQALVSKAGAPAWVNCSRNIWPGYQHLRADMAANNETLEHFEVQGSDWNLGSNAIHFLSAIEFLDGAPITDITLDPGASQREAKRSGYEEVIGAVTGRTENGASFRVSSLPGSGEPISVAVKTSRDTYDIAEGKTLISRKTGEEKPFGLLYTSQLTAPLAQIIKDKKSDLPHLAQSTDLHLKFFAAINRVFYPDDPNASEKECPVT